MQDIEEVQTRLWQAGKRPFGYHAPQFLKDSLLLAVRYPITARARLVQRWQHMQALNPKLLAGRAFEETSYDAHVNFSEAASKVGMNLGLGLAAVSIARCLQVQIPPTYAFLGTVQGRGNTAGLLITHMETVDLADLKALYDAGVRTLVVPKSLLDAVVSVVHTYAAKLPGLTACGVERVEDLLELVFLLIIQGMSNP